MAKLSLKTVIEDANRRQVAHQKAQARGMTLMELARESGWKGSVDEFVEVLVQHGSLFDEHFASQLPALQQHLVSRDGDSLKVMTEVVNAHLEALESGALEMAAEAKPVAEAAVEEEVVEEPSADDELEAMMAASDESLAAELSGAGIDLAADLGIGEEPASIDDLLGEAEPAEEVSPEPALDELLAIEEPEPEPVPNPVPNEEEEEAFSLDDFLAGEEPPVDVEPPAAEEAVEAPAAEEEAPLPEEAPAAETLNTETEEEPMAELSNEAEALPDYLASYLEEAPEEGGDAMAELDLGEALAGEEEEEGGLDALLAAADAELQRREAAPEPEAAVAEEPQMAVAEEPEPESVLPPAEAAAEVALPEEAAPKEAVEEEAEIEALEALAEEPAPLAEGESRTRTLSETFVVSYRGEEVYWGDDQAAAVEALKRTFLEHGQDGLSLKKVIEREVVQVVTEEQEMHFSVDISIG